MSCLGIFHYVRNILQVTVPIDHPVSFVLHFLTDNHMPKRQELGGEVVWECSVTPGLSRLVWYWVFCSDIFFLDSMLQKKYLTLTNKPAVQVAGADPSRCNSTNRLNLPLH